MYKIENIKNSKEIIIPVAQRLTGLLGIFPGESDIYTICKTDIIFDKRALVIREIVKCLCVIYTRQTKSFFPSGMSLKADSKAFNVTCENSYFYDKALTQTCYYLIPNQITDGGLIELLNALVMWKQNPSFQRFPALAVVLILYLLQCLVNNDKRLHCHQDTLLQILIYTQPEQLVEVFCWQLNDIIAKINMEEELEDE